MPLCRVRRLRTLALAIVAVVGPLWCGAVGFVGGMRSARAEDPSVGRSSRHLDDAVVLASIQRSNHA